MKRRDLERHLADHGCAPIREGARHAIWEREGLSLLAIAQRLDDEGVPTARGSRYWWPSTVASALRYPRPHR